jgi:serine/threonine protein kinase
MDTNLGEGLSAKCIISPSLKCGKMKRSSKYVSKIVESDENMIDSILNNEIEISRLIKSGPKSQKWIDDNFALVEKVCPKSGLSKLTITKCRLSANKKNTILLMRNVGCNALYKGSKIRTNRGLARILKTRKKSLSIKYNNNNKSINIDRSELIRYCGDFTNKQVLDHIKVLGNCFIKQMMIKLLQGVKYLHSIGISHCDLKNGNIVMDSNYNVRIIDFGSSIHLSSIKSENSLRAKLSMFTPYFVPPELIIIQYWMNNYNKETTITKAFEVSGILKTPKTIKLIERIYKNRDVIKKDLFYSKSPSIFKYDVYSLGRFLDLLYKVIRLKTPPNIKKLVDKMLEPDYKKRISINKCLKILQH